MWVVKYYMTGGTRSTRRFATLHDATRFCVYDVGYGQVDSVYLDD
jgi:hypothetical protein